MAEFPFEFGSTQPSGRLTISLGVATFPDDGAEPALVLAAADRALFAAKNAGRNRVRVAGTVGCRRRHAASPSWAPAPGAACSPAVAARRGHEVALWEIDRAAADALARDRTSPRSVAGFRLPAEVTVSSDIGGAVAGRDMVVLAVPSEFVAAHAACAARPGAARRRDRRLRVEGPGARQPARRWSR